MKKKVNNKSIDPKSAFLQKHFTKIIWFTYFVKYCFETWTITFDNTFFFPVNVVLSFIIKIHNKNNFSNIVVELICAIGNFFLRIRHPILQTDSSSRLGIFLNSKLAKYLSLVSQLICTQVSNCEFFFYTKNRL